jgi:hypothetical protein
MDAPTSSGRSHVAFALVAVTVVLLFADAGCRDRQPVAETTTQAPPAAAPVDQSPRPGSEASASRAPVQIEMHNVRLHLDEGIVLDVTSLRGEMISLVNGQPPVFDDPRSYRLQVAAADVSMDMPSLTNLMNRHVFAGEKSPLSDIEMEIDEGRLKQKAKLHKGIVLPISTTATVSATDDGRMRLSTQKVSALGVPAKGLLDLFNLELDDLLKLKEQRGIEIVENDIIISPGRILPPPELRGRLTRVEIVGNRLVQRFGQGPPGKRLTPPDQRSPNYIYFSGSQLRFGKLTMTGADLQLIDADPRDPFDFFPVRYNQQLVAGYSRNTPEGGLKTYMPDFNDLRRVGQLTPK